MYSQRLTREVNTSTLSPRLFRILCAGLVMGVAVVLQAGCGGAKEITRSTALQMIEESEQFKAPITVTLKDEKEFKIFSNSPDETEQAVRERVLRMHLESNPTAAVLRHLGYVEVQVSVVEPPRQMVKGSSATTPWVLNIVPALTEKGRELARAQGLSGEKAVPLARRELVEVTGIRDQGGQAAADFTWKAVSNEAGEAFDPSTTAFKDLPAGLQQALANPRGIGPFSKSGTVGWDKARKSTASFQKYDDGWRLVTISELP